MNVINPEDISDIEQARKIIADLQVCLMAREQSLDDLVRAVEIAEATKQMNLTSSFREAAIEQLRDRLVIPESNNVEDLKVRIYE